MKTIARHLGVRLDGHPLRAGRLPARACGRDDRRARAARGRRARRPDRRLRVPLPAGAERGERRRDPRGARARPRHLLPRRRAASRSALRARRPRQPGPGGARRGGEDRGRRRQALRRARRADDRLARDRGLQLPVPDALRGELGLVHRRARRGGREAEGRGPGALARAQELRAGDEDPDAEHRDDAVRDPRARASAASTTSR